MKTKIKIAASVIIALLAIILFAFLSQKDTITYDYSVTKQGLQAILENSELLIKYSSGDITEYYGYYTPDDGFIDLLNINDWEIAAESEGAIPYAVIRLGEGFEVVIYDNNMVYVQNIYASSNKKGDSYYITDISLSDIIQYLKAHSLTRDKSDISKHTFIN